MKTIIQKFQTIEVANHWNNKTIWFKVKLHLILWTKLSIFRIYINSNKNTTSLFLKGRNAISEIDIATKVYFFEFEKIKSLSSDDGCVLKINNIRTYSKNKNAKINFAFPSEVTKQHS